MGKISEYAGYERRSNHGQCELSWAKADSNAKIFCGAMEKKMRIVENCWDDLNASECDFGTHVYQNSVAKIYVDKGLDVRPKLLDIFDRKNEGFVGHCVLIFYGVREIEFVIREYTRENENFL